MNVDEQEKVKATVRKLMAYANDGSASEAEIANAMARAATLIDKHHLDVNDIGSAEEKAADAADAKMGRFTGKTESSKFHRWETTLAHAISGLFGSIKHYLDNNAVPLRINGVVQVYTGKYAGQIKKCRQIVFYGVEDDAREAAALFTEWAHLIATMGVIRWGGAYRGEGEAYCQGFADQIYMQVATITDSRNKLEVKAPKLLPREEVEGSTALMLIGDSKAITLSAKYEVLQQRAADYLEQDLGVELSQGSGRQGSGNAGGGAYREGLEHGAKAGFGRAKKQGRLEGPR